MYTLNKQCKYNINFNKFFCKIKFKIYETFNILWTFDYYITVIIFFK